MCLLGIGTTGYLLLNYQELVLRAGLNTQTDIIVGIIGVLMVFEATRRTVGWPMLTVALIFVAYAFLGPYMPGILAHRGVGFDELVSHLFFTTEGIFGVPMGVSSTFIYLFILFGAYLDATGLGKFFIDMANALAGWAIGGPAKVAVLSSGLMGTVSGSSVANVAGTGSFTIPMMKKLGYRPSFAGAVEAAASTGGQLMPPVMGAAAFLMAEFVGVPYIEVVKAAVIPALLYYTGIWLSVHYEAKKYGLKGTPRDQPSKIWPLTPGKRSSGGSPDCHRLPCLYQAILRCVLPFMPLADDCLCCMRKNTRITFAQFINGLVEGSQSVLGVLIACASAGIIIGVVTKTGVGLKLATALLDLAQGKMIPAMFFTMITFPDPRHGRSDDGKLLYYGGDLCADSDCTGDRDQSGLRAFLCFLFRNRGGYHTAGGIGSLCGFRDRESASDENGAQCDAAGGCRFYRAVYSGI